MKRYAALALVITLILCIFVSCGKKKKVDGAQIIADDAGNEYVVATDKDGGYIRGDNGEVVILATNENGKAYTDESGETVTENRDLRTALVIGNLIEFERYYIELPDGWSNSASFSDMVFRNEATGDQIWVMERKGTSIATAMQEYSQLRNGVTGQFPDATTEDFPVEINGETCAYSSVFVPEDAEGTPSYFGETYVDHGGYMYTIRVTSKRDVTNDVDDIIKVVSSIQFK